MNKHELLNLFSFSVFTTYKHTNYQIILILCNMFNQKIFAMSRAYYESYSFTMKERENETLHYRGNFKSNMSK